MGARRVLDLVRFVKHLTAMRRQRFVFLRKDQNRPHKRSAWACEAYEPRLIGGYYSRRESLRNLSDQF
jgi:hypothetical protein